MAKTGSQQAIQNGNHKQDCQALQCAADLSRLDGQLRQFGLQLPPRTFAALLKKLDIIWMRGRKSTAD